MIPGLLGLIVLGVSVKALKPVLITSFFVMLLEG